MNPTQGDSITIINALETFIREELLYDRDDVVLDQETLLLQQGYVDSMGIFRLIDFIEQEFGVALQPSEIQVEHFRSIDTIFALVKSRGEE